MILGHSISLPPVPKPIASVTGARGFASAGLNAFVSLLTTAAELSSAAESTPLEARTELLPQKPFSIGPSGQGATLEQAPTLPAKEKPRTSKSGHTPVPVLVEAEHSAAIDISQAHAACVVPFEFQGGSALPSKTITAAPEGIAPQKPLMEAGGAQLVSATADTTRP